MKHLSIKRYGNDRFEPIFTPKEMRLRRCLQAQRWRRANLDWFLPKLNETRRAARQAKMRLVNPNWNGRGLYKQGVYKQFTGPQLPTPNSQLV